MTSSNEIEIKFRVTDTRALKRLLRSAKFRLATPRTHEMNRQYELPNLKEARGIVAAAQIW
jgi:hypothetical protein